MFARQRTTFLSNCSLLRMWTFRIFQNLTTCMSHTAAIAPTYSIGRNPENSEYRPTCISDEKYHTWWLCNRIIPHVTICTHLDCHPSHLQSLIMVWRYWLRACLRSWVQSICPTLIPSHTVPNHTYYNVWTS